MGNLSQSGIAYKIVGDNQSTTILFIHGLMASMNHWDNISNVLKYKGVKSIIIDLPGHGESDNIQQKENNLLYKVALQVLNLIDELELNNVILVGHSLGAVIIEEMLLIDTSKFKKAVFVNIAGLTYLRAKNLKLDSIYRKEKQLLFNGEIEAAWDLHQQYGLWAKESNPHQYKESKKIFLEMNTISYANYETSLNQRENQIDPLKNINLPCLFLTSDGDDPVLIKTAEIYAQTLPKGEISIIKGVRHSPHLENTEAFIHQLDEFIAY